MTNPVHAFHSAVLASLGAAPDTIEPGRFQRFSTNGRRGDVSGWCKLFADLRGGVFGCHRASVSETWIAADRASMTRAQRAELARQVMAATVERHAQQRQHWADNAKRLARVWAQCLPLVPGDAATQYLKRRGFAGVWPLPECLRLHRALPYWEADTMLGEFPTLVAPLTAPNGHVLALHRTYLTTHGHKAPVPSVKKLTGTAGTLAGGCIALHRPRDGVIGIAEGIETALAAWCASTVPTVAAYSAGNLAAWKWPGGVRRVVIFGDNDRAGRDAAHELQTRVLAAGLQCQVLTPTEDGADWADVWAQRGHVTAEGTAA